MPANQNFYCALEASFTEAGDDPAFVTPDGTTTTYGDLSGDVASMAAALRLLGIGQGSRVMVQVEKSVANVCLYLATLKLGAVYAPLNSAYLPAELDYFIADAEPGVLVVPRERAGALRSIAERHGVGELMTLEADGSGSLSDLAAGQPPFEQSAMLKRDDLAALIYTSGTTGRSKGAMITHENLRSNAVALRELWRFQPGDVALHALPIFHVHGLFVALHTALLGGCKMLWLAKFDCDAVMRAMPAATVMMGVPTFYTRLLERASFGKEQTNNMRLFISGSAPLLPEAHDAFERRTGHKILERYGMTEAGMITSNPYDGERIAGTVGYALPGISLRVADADGDAAEPGDIGVLEVKGPNVCQGYWRNEEKTAEEFRADGYFITGDLVEMAPDGRVCIAGRTKDLIISGGLNIYPKEIETQINDLGGIAESAVVGVPDADFGEAVIAVIVIEPDAPAPSESDIIAALSGKLARFKLPKRVFVAADLPRNAMGKVQKNELRDQYADTFST